MNKIVTMIAMCCLCMTTACGVEDEKESKVDKCMEKFCRQMCARLTICGNTQWDWYVTDEDIEECQDECIDTIQYEAPSLQECREATDMIVSMSCYDIYQIMVNP